MRRGVKSFYRRLVFVLNAGIVSWCIDPVQEVGYCKNLSITPDYALVYANEGVWFPQYRSRSKGVEDFSCHILYEGLSRSQEDNHLSLKQSSYYSVRGKAERHPKITLLDPTEEIGVYTSDELLDGNGMTTKYHVILKITPDIRLRYVCSNSTKLRKDFDLVYVETRRSVGLVKDIMAGVKTLLQAGLRATLVKINQTNCTRPISSMGYDESLFFDES